LNGADLAALARDCFEDPMRRGAMAKKKAKARRRKPSKSTSRIATVADIERHAANDAANRERLAAGLERARASWAPVWIALHDAAVAAHREQTEQTMKVYTRFRESESARLALIPDIGVQINMLAKRAAARQAARDARGHAGASRHLRIADPQIKTIGRRPEITRVEFDKYADSVVPQGQPGWLSDADHAEKLGAILGRSLTRQQFRGARLRKKHLPV
jgi:hypothetical protein